MSRISAIVKFKCPNCEQGEVFGSKGFFSFGKMKETCSSCGHKFEKEPGFFFGAMYVSYALNVAELLIVFFSIQPLFEDFFDPGMLPFVIGAIIILMPFNFKLARILWMYMFTKKGSSAQAMK